MRFSRLFFALGSLCMAGVTQASVVYDVPTNWRMQDYFSDVVIIYYVAPDCDQGGVKFPATASQDDKNRLWSAVLSAKATGKRVGIFYSGTGASCEMTSFFVEN